MLAGDHVRALLLFVFLFIVDALHVLAVDLLLRGKCFLVGGAQQDRVIDKLVAKTDRRDDFATHHANLLVAARV